VAALRAHAKGLYLYESSVELLIGHASWLYREDFLDVAVEFGCGILDGSVMAAVDWTAAAAALEAGRLPCSASEGQVLRIAASIAGGVPVSLGEAVSGLDDRNLGLVAGAVLHAGGRRGGLAAPVGDRRCGGARW